MGGSVRQRHSPPASFRGGDFSSVVKLVQKPPFQERRLPAVPRMPLPPMWRPPLPSSAFAHARLPGRPSLQSTSGSSPSAPHGVGWPGQRPRLAAQPQMAEKSRCMRGADGSAGPEFNPHDNISPQVQIGVFILESLRYDPPGNIMHVYIHIGIRTDTYIHKHAHISLAQPYPPFHLPPVFFWGGMPAALQKKTAELIPSNGNYIERWWQAKKGGVVRFELIWQRPHKCPRVTFPSLIT